MKKYISSMILTVILFCIMIGNSTVLADESYNQEKQVSQEFVESIMSEDEFETWNNSDTVFGYALFDYDCTTINSILFYVENEEECIGYVIVDCLENRVVEFSTGESPYDRIITNDYSEYVYVYKNATTICSVNGSQYYVETDGSLVAMSESLLRYDPQLQGNNNCIVAAISNLFWYYGGNGYASLTSGKSFSQLMSSVNSIMVAQGGYANNNIPNTISNYVANNTSYSVTVTNLWSPTLSQLLNEVVSRPCLLGFAAGSPYHKTFGHMTVCVGTTVQGGSYYVKVMDGHSTSIRYKLWGSYNDFISKVRLS